MPLYPYRCTQCGHKFEKIQHFSDEPETVCPKCGGVLERPLTVPGFQFKGSGWYVTDYAGKSSATAPSEGGDSGAAKAGEKSSDKSGDSTKEAKTESKPAASENTNKGAANRKKK